MIQDGAARAGRWSPTLLLSSFLLVLGACGSPGIENCRAEGGCSTCSVGVDQPAEPEAASPEPDPALAAGPSEEGVEEAGEATPTMLEESSEGVEDAADEAVQEIEGAVEESSEPELGSDETPLSDGAPLPDEEAAPTGTAPEVELAEEDAGGSLVPVTPAAPVAIELASLQPDAQGRVWTNAESAQLEGRVLNPRAAVLRVARGEQASEELAVDAEGAFALELALAEGASTRVRLEAEGAAPLSVEFIQDATPPALSFPGAEGGSVRVREASYPLRVSASDAWLASVRVDGRPMSAGADGLSTAQLELRDGAQETRLASHEAPDVVSKTTVPLEPGQARKATSQLIATRRVPGFGNQAQRIEVVFRRDVAEYRRLVVVQRTVGIAREHRRQVETKPVDAHGPIPVPHAVDDHLSNVPIGAVQRVACSRVVGVGLSGVTGSQVVGAVVDSLEAIGRGASATLGGVVVDDVENDLEAGVVQGVDHVAKLPRRSPWRRGLLGIRAMGRKEPHGHVTPEVTLVGVVLMHRH